MMDFLFGFFVGVAFVVASLWICDDDAEDAVIEDDDDE